jgi:ZIP family zinc transporter
MIQGRAISLVAIFLSNIPEGLFRAAGMKKAGRSASYVFGLWLGIALISGLASLVGYSEFSEFSQDVIAATGAVRSAIDS